MDDKIYFTLDTRIPETLYAKYRGRVESIGVNICFPVLEAHLQGKILLEEEKIRLAEDYLRSILLI